MKTHKLCLSLLGMLVVGLLVGCSYASGEPIFRGLISGPILLHS
jgi:hypothetical protein